MKKLLTIILFVEILSGCYSAKKANKQVSRAIVGYRQQTGKQFRDAYPFKVSIDSTIKDSAEFNFWKQQSKDIVEFYEKLLLETPEIEIHDTIFTKEKSENLSKKNLDLLKLVNKLKEKLDNVPFMVDSVFIVTENLDKINQLSGEVVYLTKKNDSSLLKLSKYKGAVIVLSILLLVLLLPWIIKLFKI